MDISRIWSNEKQLFALTGLTMDEATELLPDFAFEMTVIGRFKTANGGRPSKLDEKGVLLLLMMFYRHYDTLDALGALFDLDNSNVQRWIDDAEVAMKQILEKKSSFQSIAHKLMKQPKPLKTTREFTSTALSSLYAALKTR